MIRIILLAAGSARRFGEDKLMWPIDGKPMIMHTLEKLINIQENTGHCVTVVTREGAVSKLIAGLPVETVINPEPERGISSSISCAIESFDSDVDAAVFCVADQPWLSPEAVCGLIDRYIESGKACGCLACEGETGNPCIFSRKLFSELNLLEGDKGGKKVLLKHIDDCCLYEIEDPIQLTDIDTKPQ